MRKYKQLVIILKTFVTFVLIIPIFIALSILLFRTIFISTQRAFSHGKLLKGIVIKKESSITKFLSNGGVTPITNYYLRIKTNGKSILVKISEQSFKSKSTFIPGEKVIVAQYKNRYFIQDNNKKTTLKSSWLVIIICFSVCLIFLWLHYTKNWLSL